MKKLSVILAVVSIIVLAVFAYGEMGGRGMGPGMMGGRMDVENHMSGHLMGLDLDEQQKTLIGEIRSRIMKDHIRRKADLSIVHIELRDLLSQDPVDMKAVEAKLKQAEMMRTEMHLAHINTMEDIKTKLTSEQRKKFLEMIESGPMMEGMGMMQGSGAR